MQPELTGTCACGALLPRNGGEILPHYAPATNGRRILCLINRWAAA